MFGPLPKFYRFALAATIVAFCATVGLWMGAYPQVPVLISPGVALGLLVGAPLAWLSVHETRRGRDTTLRAHHRRR